MIPVLDPNQLGGYAPGQPWTKNLDNPVGYLKLHNSHVYQTDVLVNGFAEVDFVCKRIKIQIQPWY